jgi:hypothetical protein
LPVDGGYNSRFPTFESRRIPMELALDRQRIADLKSRLDSLRRYL